LVNSPFKERFFWRKGIRNVSIFSACVSTYISKTGFYKKYYKLCIERGVSQEQNELSYIIFFSFFSEAILILKR